MPRSSATFKASAIRFDQIFQRVLLFANERVGDDLRDLGVREVVILQASSGHTLILTSRGATSFPLVPRITVRWLVLNPRCAAQ
jgi:hypothetical protein